MKKNYFLFYTLLSITLILQSCVGYNTVVDTYVKPQTYLKKHSYYSANYKNLPVYNDTDRPTDDYETLVRFTVTGNNSASREKLINKMKKEAAMYKMDGLILLDEKRVIRETFNGVALAINLVSIFATYDNCGEPTDLPMDGEYESLELEAIGFRYK